MSKVPVISGYADLDLFSCSTKVLMLDFIKKKKKKRKKKDSDWQDLRYLIIKRRRLINVVNYVKVDSKVGRRTRIVGRYLYHRS